MLLSAAVTCTCRLTPEMRIVGTAPGVVCKRPYLHGRDDAVTEQNALQVPIADAGDGIHFADLHADIEALAVEAQFGEVPHLGSRLLHGHRELKIRRRKHCTDVRLLERMQGLGRRIQSRLKRVDQRDLQRLALRAPSYRVQRLVDDCQPSIPIGRNSFSPLRTWERA